MEVLWTSNSFNLFERGSKVKNCSVGDGWLGGLPMQDGGKTELETACTLIWTARGMAGLHHSVPFGITPGSGQAHLGLGYDPTQFEIGRGVPLRWALILIWARMMLPRGEISPPSTRRACY